MSNLAQTETDTFNEGVKDEALIKEGLAKSGKRLGERLGERSGERSGKPETPEPFKAETKTFTSLVTVHHNGETFAPNTRLSLTEAEFTNLKLIGAVEGDEF